MTLEVDVLAGLFPYPRLLLSHGAGSWVVDHEGKRYLDFTAGLGVMALGHGRQDLTRILAEQFGQLSHCSNLFANTPALDLAARLKKASFASKVFFANSGAEVNEAALKFARLLSDAERPHKKTFIAFERSFHGRTMGALSVTHEPAYREPFAPLIPHVEFAPFNDLAAVRQLMDHNVCGVIVEPIQGEGGVHPAQPAFLAGLRELCDTYDAALIFDEVQCGMGRTGTMFAYQHYGVVPDIMTLAKPLAAGLPLGAVLVNDKIAQLLRPGMHGTTFGGGPAVCAVAVAVFDIIARSGFLQEVHERGAYLAAGLAQVVEESPIFSGTRGVGLMQAAVVRDPAATGLAGLLEKAKRRGLLVTRAGKDAVRLLPPLTCSNEEIDIAMETLAAVAAEASAGGAAA